MLVTRCGPHSPNSSRGDCANDVAHVIRTSAARATALDLKDGVCLIARIIFGSPCSFEGRSCRSLRRDRTGTAAVVYFSRGCRQPLIRAATPLVLSSVEPNRTTERDETVTTHLRLLLAGWRCLSPCAAPFAQSQSQ